MNGQQTGYLGEPSAIEHHYQANVISGTYGWREFGIVCILMWTYLICTSWNGIQTKTQVSLWNFHFSDFCHAAFQLGNGYKNVPAEGKCVLKMLPLSLEAGLNSFGYLVWISSVHFLLHCHIVPTLPPFFWLSLVEGHGARSYFNRPITLLPANHGFEGSQIRD